MTDPNQRLLRSSLRRNIRQSRASLITVLTIDPVPDWLHSASIGELCLARRYLGPQRVEAVLQDTGVGIHDTLGEVDVESRRLVAAMLRELYPNLI